MKRFIHVHETFVPWVKRGGEGGDEREVPGGGRKTFHAHANTVKRVIQE